MTWFRRGLGFLFRSRRTEEIQREVAFHLAERADELMATGMTRNEATREARRRFGNPQMSRGNHSGGGVFQWFESLLADIRYASRSLLRSPGFTVVAILSLGLGIGANTAIFSLYNALVMRSLPVERPEELVQVTYEEGRDYFTNPLWEELRNQQDVLPGIFAFGSQSFNLADGGQERNVRGYWVSGDFFRTLGVLPALGRTLVNDDDYRGCPAVAVVSYGFWQREFGGAADAVGRTLPLDGKPFEIVGVADRSFTGVVVGRSTDVYVPICTFSIVRTGSNQLDARSTWFLEVLGRTSGGMTAEEAGARLAAHSSSVFGATIPPLWDAEGQDRYRAYTFSARPASTGVSYWRGTYGPALLVLMGVVGVVLLIACGNVANLLLARATKRRHEVSIRRAIGSGRGRLIRLLVTESLLLSFVSVIVAVVFARWASAFLVGMLSTTGSMWLNLGLDMRVLGFTFFVATVTGIVFGLAPAWRATGVAPQAALRTAGREIDDMRGRFALGKVLVVAQLTLSLSLLVVAGLLIGTLARLQTVDTGFNRDGVLLVSVNKRNADYSTEESRLADQELLDRIRAVPGARSASAAKINPIGSSSWNTNVEVDGFEATNERDAMVWFNSTSDGFFATLETPLLAGRDFDARDALGSVQVAIINETMAQRFYANPQPLGRHFRVSHPGEDIRIYEVIGVVADTKYDAVDEETRAIAYFPLSQEREPWGVTRLQIRTAGTPSGAIADVNSAIADVHPRISVQFSTLEDVVAASLTRPRILAMLSGFFGAVALLLAMIGLYGTLSYRVTSRRNEIGLRLALGAAQTQVVGMILREVGRLVLVGVGVGVAVTIAGTRILASFLFGVEATDPTTLAVSVGILALVSLAAGALPAWQAARLDPMETLREE